MGSKAMSGTLLIAIPIVLLVGYEIGRMVERKAPIRVEYSNPTTKCMAWDYGGKDGQRRCFQWRRT